ncbi:armadillo-type protein [Coprinopsis sp. MPI-PUGE-AT-0042]|nr:armadillo-type protein [Coprinopsis sp. MPI-PUGE-AT-0042]
MNATVKDHGSSFAENEVQSLEPVTPLQASANRWNRVSFATAADADSPEIVERKIKVLLRKLTMERFDTISDQIVAWANKSERERDCRTLIEVIRLIFVEATNEASLSEMYARLCRKIMEQISPKVQDEGIKNQEGKPIAGGQLFRKYLLNRCQEDFESGWAAKDATAAANSATDEAFKTSDLDKEEEVEPYSEEYYAAAKAKRQGLGLIKFIGELFRLQMLTERIMHECVKKLLGNVENPEEEEIESLCKLLTTIGHLLDVPKAQGQMDIYFLRMKELTKSNNISQRVHFMLQDVIEMRARKWVPLLKPTVPPAPITIAEVHENTLLEMAARDGEIMQHQMPMSRTAKAGSDPSNLGKVSKKGQLTSFGPSKTATKAEKRHPIPLTPHRMYSLNYNNYHNAASEPKPVLRPLHRVESRTRDRPLWDYQESSRDQYPHEIGRGASWSATKTNASSAAVPRSDSGGDEKDGAKIPPSMSEADAIKKIGEDCKELFAVRNIDKSENYFRTLPTKYHSKLVDRLGETILMSTIADAELVASIFDRASSKQLVDASAFEQGLAPHAELLKSSDFKSHGYRLLALMVNGAKLDAGARLRLGLAVHDLDSEFPLSLFYDPYSRNLDNPYYGNP